jgi:hypothetical protein
MRLAQSLAALLGLAVLVACQPPPGPAQFVGKWKSSRLATPLHLRANGEWEIRNDDGPVLQYGVWQLHERRFVWSVRIDGALVHDPNDIVSVSQRRFELRERDGRLTQFERLE